MKEWKRRNGLRIGWLREKRRRGKERPVEGKKGREKEDRDIEEGKSRK